MNLRSATPHADKELHKAEGNAPAAEVNAPDAGHTGTESEPTHVKDEGTASSGNRYRVSPGTADSGGTGALGVYAERIRGVRRRGR